MNTSRRALLRAVPPALLLSGCASLGLTLTPSQVATDAASIAGALGTVVSNLGAGLGLDAATIAQIGQLAISAQTAATGVSASLTATQAAPLVTQIATAVNTVVAILAKIAILPPPIPTILMAAQVLLPVLESAVGIAVPAGGAQSGMTPDQARAILAGK